MKYMVGEEETNFFLNSIEEMSFVDQLIERREGSMIDLNPTLWLTPLSDRTYTRTAEPMRKVNFIVALQAVRSNNEGRGVTSIMLKSKSALSSATHQDNRGAKLNFGMNSTAAVSLPIMKTVGEEETIEKVNTIPKMSFADQLIERREGSTFNVKSRASLTPLSDRTYTRTAETRKRVNFKGILSAVRSNYEGRGVTIRRMKSNC